MADKGKLFEIALTGGSGSGKTSSLSYLSEKLNDLGFRVFIAPEVATICILGGLPDISEIYKAKKNGDPTYDGVQRQFLSLQRDIRKNFQEMAALFPDEDRVIIYDRAEMDILSYSGAEAFKEAMEEFELDYYDVRDSYDGVIHLVTAAIGAEEHYTRENNAARIEGLEGARKADKRTLKAWNGSKLKIIDNSTDFEGKLRRVLSAVTSVIGVPEPLEIERKFLLGEVPSEAVLRDAGAHKALIKQTYISSPEGVETRVRARTADNTTTYYKTEKIDIDGGKTRQEREERLTKREYLNLLEQRDPNKDEIIKERYCFPYNYTYYEVDILLSPERTKGVALLEVELTEADKDKDLILPDFLVINREVTSEKEYKNSSLASK